MTSYKYVYTVQSKLNLIHLQDRCEALNKIRSFKKL